MYFSIAKTTNDLLIPGGLTHLHAAQQDWKNAAARKAYSSHPIVLLDVSRHAGFMLGDWDYAKNTMQRAKRLTSERNNAIYHVDAVFALVEDVSPEAWEDCVKAYSEHSKVSNLLVNACAKKFTKPYWEQQTANNLVKFDLNNEEKKKIFMENMRFSPELIAAITTL